MKHISIAMLALLSACTRQEMSHINAGLAKSHLSEINFLRD
jgi:hypothetical protein